MDLPDNLSNEGIHTINPNAPINPSSFLIVRTDRLGDVVLTLPIATAIKQSIPNASVSFLLRNYTASLVERCPDVDEIRIADDKLRVRNLIELFRGTDIALFPSPRFSLALAAFLARVPKRVGTGYRWYSFLFNHKIYEHRKTAEHHEAEYNLRMLSTIGIAADPDLIANIQLKNNEKNMIDNWVTDHLRNTPFIVIHAVSGGSSHPWPEKYFIGLARDLSEKYGVKIVLTGTQSESHTIGRIQNSIGNSSISFIGKSIPELAALLKRASAVVAVSTGPGQLASALGAPTVGLFPLPLPISKMRWGFRGKRVMNLSPAPIAGCPNCQNCTCMERIDVQTVEQAICNFLEPDASEFHSYNI